MLVITHCMLPLAVPMLTGSDATRDTVGHVSRGRPVLLRTRTKMMTKDRKMKKKTTLIWTTKAKTTIYAGPNEPTTRRIISGMSSMQETIDFVRFFLLSALATTDNASQINFLSRRIPILTSYHIMALAHWIVVIIGNVGLREPSLAFDVLSLV